MATTQTKPRLITADDLLRLYSEGVNGELIRGVLCETMPPGLDHGEIVINIGFLLKQFLQTHRLGRVMGGDPGIWIERSPDTVRAPDIAFYTLERLPPGVKTPGYSELIPDMVVEVVSPNDRPTQVNDKAEMWLRRGVRLVWVVWPDRGTVEVYSPTQRVVELSDDAMLEGGDILPGFSTPVTSIFEE